MVPASVPRLHDGRLQGFGVLYIRAGGEVITDDLYTIQIHYLVGQELLSQGMEPPGFFFYSSSVSYTWTAVSGATPGGSVHPAVGRVITTS